MPEARHYMPMRERHCPRCGGDAYRVPRRFVDLLTSAFFLQHRYRCSCMGCSWEGNLRVTPSDTSTRKPARRGPRSIKGGGGEGSRGGKS